jgi:hypothetical protein
MTATHLTTSLALPPFEGFAPMRPVRAAWFDLPENM